MADTANPAVENEGPEGQIPLPQESLEQLSAWAQGELDISKLERQDLEDNLVKWEKQYEAQPDVAEKTFPWEKASNLVVPITAIHVDSIQARLMNNVFGAKDLVIARARASAPEWQRVIEPYNEWANWKHRTVLKTKQVARDWFLSMAKSGTGILKLVWEEKWRKVRRLGPDGSVQESAKLIHRGPRLYNVPLFDFFVSSDAYASKSVQDCEWVAQRETFTKKQLLERQYSGYFIDVERVFNAPVSQGTDMDVQKETEQGIEVVERDEYEVFEFWASYDVDEDGLLEEIVFSLEPETGTILRAVYNYYNHQERPFHLLPYMTRDNALFGMGICQMLEHIQSEISTLHNLRIDNATLANTQVFKRKRTSSVSLDEIYPGAILDVDEEDDITDLPMGRQHPTLLMEEQHSNAIAERRTSISDYAVGRESSAIGSRATATSTLAIIREGNKRFKMTAELAREVISDIEHQSTMMYAQFMPDKEVMFEMFNPEEKQIMSQFFQLPSELTRDKILIEVPVVPETENKEVQQQTLLTLMSLLQNFFMSVGEGMMIAFTPGAPPPIVELARKGAEAATALMERILDSFDIRDTETFLPNIESLLGLQQVLEQQLLLSGGGRRDGTGAATGLAGLQGGPAVGINGGGPAGANQPPAEGPGGEGQP